MNALQHVQVEMKQFPQRFVLHQLQVVVLNFSVEGKSCEEGVS